MLCAHIIGLRAYNQLPYAIAECVSTHAGEIASKCMHVQHCIRYHAWFSKLLAIHKERVRLCVVRGRVQTCAKKVFSIPLPGGPGRTPCPAVWARCIGPM